MENSERLGRQLRPGFEPGTSRLPVLSVTAVPLVGRCSSRLPYPLHQLIGADNFYHCYFVKLEVI